MLVISRHLQIIKEQLPQHMSCPDSAIYKILELPFQANDRLWAYPNNLDLLATYHWRLLV